MSDVTFEDVLAAAERLEGVVHRTPIATSRTLDERVGARVYLKCENLQRVGAFKIRGAYNAISRLSEDERRRGVLAYSSGNHAQGVALAGRLLGVATTIVMPKDAPATKLAATRGYGARVVLYDRAEVSRREVAAQLQEEGGYSVIPPFDHPHIAAGQGTAALELFQDKGELDFLLVPCGGAGLLGGSAVAAKGLAPRCRVYGVEPEVGDDATRSFYSGEIQTVRNPPTIADGTRTESVGKLNFELMRRHVDAMHTVTEEAIVEAVRFLFFRLKLVVEPSGALGVAALLSGAVEVTGRVGVILSGGNVDGPTMAAILS
ncbi:MAG: threo-3-hydroxy-L-aspartate ammonia-lyase [Acidobacteriota bacterium]|nr:threo-3-hydroxy-L-aspartate ammonia-lyase [Acidobacteriota bacterium]MDH3523059.1 threo-3-hydroxy-L-aspartate ammonia-lyase [Acidobacteriota bacterium]